MKKGFTIIEIIISIGLILLVGTTSIVSFNYIKNKNNVSILNSMSDEILTALRLYIETNDDLKSSVYEDKEGLVVTLKTLENNGLIDFTDVDIDDKYVVALLSQESDCTDITTVNNWDVTGGTLNICLKGSSNSQSVKETLISSGSYIAKGANPNNWVIFEVESKTDEVTYFPNDDDKNLWRILSINDQGNIKLVYNNVVNDKNSSDKWDYIYLKDNDNSKKQKLFNNIEYNEWIISYNYLLDYDKKNNVYYYNMFNNTELLLGTINIEEYYDTFIMGKSYIQNTEFVIGRARNGGKYYSCYLHKIIAGGFEGGLDFGQASEKSLSYLPALVLNENVKIVKNTECSNDAIQGSESCPYKLECNNC